MTLIWISSRLINVGRVFLKAYIPEYSEKNTVSENILKMLITLENQYDLTNLNIATTFPLL